MSGDNLKYVLKAIKFPLLPLWWTNRAINIKEKVYDLESSIVTFNFVFISVT
jgi:hypothetical protein